MSQDEQNDESIFDNERRTVTFSDNEIKALKFLANASDDELKVLRYVARSGMLIKFVLIPSVLTIAGLLMAGDSIMQHFNKG
jgi:hypothetical protein